MMACGIALQRMSLAAIIIAMGMLVDNAIVVSDSALINMERGMRKRVAIMQACSTTALPLLAATVIAILTFLPIYYSPHITGELLSSLVRLSEYPDVQLGVRTDTDTFLYTGICPPPTSRGTESGTVRRKILQPFPQCFNIGCSATGRSPSAHWPLC